MDAPTKSKIMLVDDDKFLLDMYAMKFQKAGFEVNAVTEPSKVLSTLKEGYQPDVVVLDLIMPGTDGFQLLEAMRKDKLAENAAVVVLSNQGQQMDIEKAKNLKIDGYIVKATSVPSEVVEEVVTILKKRQTHSK